MTDLPDAQQFAQLIRELRRGLLHAELSDASRNLIAGVMQHGKQGTLTLKLTIKPRGDGGVDIASDYVTRVPTPPATPTIMFADEDGRWSRNRLDQDPLPLQGLDGGASHDRDARQAVSS